MTKTDGPQEKIAWMCCGTSRIESDRQGKNDRINHRKGGERGKDPRGTRGGIFSPRPLCCDGASELEQWGNDIESSPWSRLWSTPRHEIRVPDMRPYRGRVASLGLGGI